MPPAASIVHVVDDDDDARKGTARLLAAAGLHARTYATASEFLASLDPDTPGCIILDVRLPDQSGLDLQVALANHAVPLPIIFMTGHGEIPDSVRAMTAELQLSMQPWRVIAFFPEWVEKKLLERELAYGKTYGRNTEESIKETKFRVDFRNGEPRFTVIEQH